MAETLRKIDIVNVHYIKTNLSQSLVNLQSCFNVAEKTSCGSRFDANELGKLACWVPQETLEPQFLKLDNDFSDQKSGVHFLPCHWLWLLLLFASSWLTLCLFLSTLSAPLLFSIAGQHRFNKERQEFRITITPHSHEPLLQLHCETFIECFRNPESWIVYRVVLHQGSQTI